MEETICITEKMAQIRLIFNAISIFESSGQRAASILPADMARRLRPDCRQDADSTLWRPNKKPRGLLHAAL
jgi:hypothetical protein